MHITPASADLGKRFQPFKSSAFHVIVALRNRKTCLLIPMKDRQFAS
jgi:hypothetical protein